MPTPGFEFPQSAQDQIERVLRTQSEGPTQVQSVRPERQVRPPVVPREVSEAAHVHPMAQTNVSSSKTVPAVAPDPTPMPTEEYVSLALPSNFHYYPFKNLYIKPFRVPHLAKLAKSEVEGGLQTLVETVGSVLLAPGYPNPILDLSVGDLNAVMLWLRLNSFTKKTMSFTSECDNPQHHKLVADGLKPKESLRILTRVDETMIEVKSMDTIPDPDYFKIEFPEDGKVLTMRPETVRDSVQFVDHPRFAEADFQYMVRAASVLNLEEMLPERTWSLEQKVDFAENVLTTDQLLLAIEFSELVDSYGITESVKTKCAECGASGRVHIAFDARTFLSPTF